MRLWLTDKLLKLVYWLAPHSRAEVSALAILIFTREGRS